MPHDSTKLRIVIAAVCCATHIFLVNDSRAEESATPPSGDASAVLATMPLEALMQMTVTSASKFEQRVSDAPAAAVVLTAADIRDFGWRTLGDALASLPGLYVSYDRNYAYLGARGFLRPGDYDSRFLVLIDGYQVNDAVYDEAPIGTEFLIDMDLVERIEYVPGPGSAVYGSNAFFGVVNVITKKGSDINGTQVAASAGSFGEKRGRATWGWHGANGADIVLSASAYDRNGQSLYYPEFDTPDQNHGVAVGLDYDRAQQFLAKFAYREFSLEIAHSNRTKGVPDAPFGAQFNAPYSLTDTQSFVNAAWHHPLATGVELNASAYWGRYDYRSPVYVMGDPPQLNIDGDHALWYGTDVHTVVTTIARNKIVFGADFRRNARQDQYNFDVNPYQQVLDDHRSSNRAGTYVEDEVQLPAGFELNAGLRYDYETIAKGNLSPRIALIYKPTNRDTFKAIYGRAYRAPNAYELYYATSGDGGQLANPSLKPEHITTTELVYSRDLGSSARATLSLFHYDIADLISQTTDAGTGLLVFRNLNHVEANGAELSYEQQTAGGIRVRTSYSWQLARDEATESVLQNSPRHLGKLNIVVPLASDRVRVGVEALCSASRLTQASRTGGYCIGNVTIGSSKLVPHSTVSFSVYNVTDKRYADPAGPAFTQQAIAQESRTFLFKLVYGM